MTGLLNVRSGGGGGGGCRLLLELCSLPFSLFDISILIQYLVTYEFLNGIGYMMKYEG